MSSEMIRSRVGMASSCRARTPFRPMAGGGEATVSEDKATAQTRPYGAWTSPITAASLAEGAIGVSDLKVADGQLYWLENRPAEGGRLVVMTRGADGPRELTPQGFNA